MTHTSHADTHSGGPRPRDRIDDLVAAVNANGQAIKAVAETVTANGQAIRAISERLNQLNEIETKVDAIKRILVRPKPV